MKVAHITPYAPHTNGLYETSRDIVAAVRSVGVDARMIDVNGVFNGEQPAVVKGMATYLLDRGVPFVPESFVDEADIVVKHTGLGPIPDDKPIIHVLHGTPYHTFFFETDRRVREAKARQANVIAGYHLADMLNRDKRFKKFVVFYEEHLPHWRQVLDDDKLVLITPPCDNTIWKPEGPKVDLTGNPAIVSTATWRRGIEPFHLIVAFRHWVERYGHMDARLHVYAAPPSMPGLRIMGGYDGNVIFHPKVRNLDAVYRGADIALVPHKIATRTVRESLSCGCTIVGPCGQYTEHCMDPESIDSFAFVLEQAWQLRRACPGQAHANSQAAAAEFAPALAAKAWLKLYEEMG